MPFPKNSDVPIAPSQLLRQDSIHPFDARWENKREKNIVEEPGPTPDE